MNVLMLSTDREILRRGSPTQKRMEFISGAADILHILVLGSEKKSTEQISAKLVVQGVPVLHKILIPFYAYIAGKKIIGKNWIVTSQDEFIGIAGYLLKRLRRIPWEAQVHTDIASPEYRRFSLQNRIRAFIARHIYKHASLMRVVSDRVKNNLEEWRGINTVSMYILPVFIDLEKYKKKEVREDNIFRIISVSRLSPEKRIGGILESFAKLYQKHKNIELLIVGDGPERKKLQNFVSVLGIADVVEFVGHVDNVEDYYARADLYALNSAYESYGRTIIEAMAAGLPVISTDVGIADEFIKKYAVGYVVQDEEGFKNALETLYKKKELAMNMGASGKKATIQLFDKSTYITALRSAWNSCEIIKNR